MKEFFEKAKTALKNPEFQTALIQQVTTVVAVTVAAIVVTKVVNGVGDIAAKAIAASHTIEIPPIVDVTLPVE